MAVAKFREPNRARWVGIRPGHDGEQVVKHGWAVNVGTFLFYTVTAGKVLLLDEWFWTCQGAAANESSFYIRDTADVVWLRLTQICSVPAFYLSGGNALSFPIEVPAGYDICASNTVATTYQGCHFHGIEIPV